MFWNKKKEDVDLRDLHKQGKIIPLKREVQTDSSGFVDLSKKSSPRSSPSNIETPKTSTQSTANFFGFMNSNSGGPSDSGIESNTPLADISNKLKKITSQLTDIDNKIYKLEQRIDVLERKAGVGVGSDASSGLW